jgi:hypothetical protein
MGRGKPFVMRKFIGSSDGDTFCFEDVNEFFKVFLAQGDQLFRK